jgi:hypothetical protein
MAISKVILNNQTQMDVTQDTVQANNLLDGITATAANGETVTGQIATNTSSSLTASGATVTVPAGYYATNASKSVATTTHPKPTASINTSTGVVTASHTQGTGYVTGGTTTNTLQLTTQGAKTVTPTETTQEAVAAGVYTTGVVSVGAISSEYVGSDVPRKTSSNLTVSGATVTAPAGYYASAASKTVASGSATTPATTITSQPTMEMDTDSGLITATNAKTQSVTPTVSEGYVSAGTAGTITVNGASTMQLPTLNGTTVTPSKTDSVVVETAGKYMTGNITVSPVQIDLVAKTVNPSYETQVVTPNSAASTIINVTSSDMNHTSYSDDFGTYGHGLWAISQKTTNQNNPWPWVEYLENGKTYHVVFDWYRSGYNRHYVYDGDATCADGKINITLTSTTGSYTMGAIILKDPVTYVIDSTYTSYAHIAGIPRWTSDEDNPGGDTFSMTITSISETHDGLSQVTVNPMPRNLVDMSWSKIKECVNEGVDPSFLPIGTQINDKWTWQGTTYDAPWNVVHYNSQGMYLQWEWLTPDQIAFDAQEAMYYVGESGLAAGTYYITTSSAAGLTAWNSKNIQFTLTSACDPGDQFVVELPTSDPTLSRTLTVYGYGSTTAKQTATTSSGTGGTLLGTMGDKGATNGNCNGAYCVIYGNHRWSQSAMRQWLNSDAADGEWWEPQNPWDRPPSYAANRPGFLYGCSEGFRNALEPMPIVTALDTVSGFTNACETTYDKIFLPNAWQMYSQSGSDLSDIEGESWDYWKQKAKDAGIDGMMNDTTEARQVLIKYRINAHTTANGSWIRSPNRNNSGIRILTSNGSISGNSPYGPFAACPACIIKKSTPSYLIPSDLDWTAIKSMSTLGTGTSLEVGSQIVDTWTASNGNTEFDVPWDIVHYDDVSMYLRWHYNLPFTTEFDEHEAMYYVGESGLAAGTYYITTGSATGATVWNSKNIQFTLTQACDPGDQFVISSPTGDPTANRTLTVYGFGETTAKQTATTSSGTDGILLGTIGYKGNTNGNCNGVYWIYGGNHRWSQSNLRTWLNSDASAGNWFTPMNPWDRPPSYVNYPGFLYGFSSDFKNALAYSENKTLLDTISGFTNTYEITYDKIFLPGVEQINFVPDVYDVEGEPWQYYQQLAEEAGITGRFTTTNATLKIFNINATTTVDTSWLRSPHMTECYARDVTNTGYVSGTTPYTKYRACPCCKINLIK